MSMKGSCESRCCNKVVCLIVITITLLDKRIAVARTITDSKSILEGVHVDYSCNETETAATPGSHGGYFSAPGCPKSIDGFPWVHYNGKCHLAGFQSLCAPGMKMFIDPHSKNDTGICNCDCFDEVWRLDLSYSLEMAYCFNESETRHYSLHITTGRCYQLLSQTYLGISNIPMNLWYACKGTLCKRRVVCDGPAEKTSVCERRKCTASDNSLSAPTFFDEETRSYSAVGDECVNKYTNGSQTFLLTPGNWTPQCSAPWVAAAAHGIDGNSCAGGQRYSSILNTCVKSLSLDSSVG